MSFETFEYEGGWREEAEVFSEQELEELAGELLTVGNEAELDQFLGGLISKAASAVGSAIRSPLAQKVGGMLKGVAKRYLPQAGASLGSLAGSALGAATAAIPGVGAVIAPFASTIGPNLGRSLGQSAGGWLADRLELESMTQEEAELEVAKQFVRVAGEAVKRAAAAPEGSSPATIARGAVTSAIEKVAPAVLATGGEARAPSGASGRWIRHGRTIVVLGV